ncbi:DUF4136 domain-containing protein [Pseudomonas leptonychotis]|jgi:hypothetical protein|uniref:DUF4136 domain-containing protein n=1 Tax=Pseudomonas leptonychotis TaxID=2448482 RepID=A0A4T1ZTR8_9PSED|nr:DUF4136 domain-containing protein [Pseudomonas leptonychotis]TIH07695.1 DUF4136 domain-containing protein [Pseudomonas leptonychotis]
MRASLLLLPLLLILSACQTPQLERDFDPSRDFAAYRSWSWQEPGVQYKPDDPRINSDLTGQRIRSAISEQLDQRGLREAAANSAGDLKVQVWMIVDNRQQQVSTQMGGSWGNPWGGGFWGGPSYVETRTLDYQVGTLQIDLLDGKDGKLVWRGSAEQVLRNRQPSPSEREASIRSTVAEVLSQYPPH